MKFYLEVDVTRVSGHPLDRHDLATAIEEAVDATLYGQDPGSDDESEYTVNSITVYDPKEK